MSVPQVSQYRCICGEMQLHMWKVQGMSELAPAILILVHFCSGGGITLKCCNPPWIFFHQCWYCDWHCSIFSRRYSIDITKKLVPLRLGFMLFKPWVFTSRIVSYFMEKEDYNQSYCSIWSNSLVSVGEKVVPLLPSTSGTCSSGQGIMWAHNFQLLMHSPFFWPLFSNSIKCMWLQTVLWVTDSPDSANCFSKSWHCQEVENSSPKSHNLMGRLSYMGVSQSNTIAPLWRSAWGKIGPAASSSIHLAYVAMIWQNMCPNLCREVWCDGLRSHKLAALKEWCGLCHQRFLGLLNKRKCLPNMQASSRNA